MRTPILGSPTDNPVEVRVRVPSPPGTGPAGRGIAIAAATGWLPPARHTRADAVAAGLVDTGTADRLGYESLADAEGRAGPELAVAAGRKALAEAGWTGDDLGLVVHSWLYHQGHDFWSPPHYVASELGATAAEPVGVQQTSNGCAAAIAVAVSRMVADPGVTRCVVTTGDCFPPPAFDRWAGDIDVAYGDSGTALLLGHGSGPYRLMSVVSASAARYEVLYRGEDPFTPAPRWTHPAVSARRTKQAVATGTFMQRFVAAGRRAVQHVVRTALAESDLTADDPRVKVLALPRIGAGALRQFYEPCLVELGLNHAEIVDLGRASGHLGAGDSIANLADLADTDRLAPGEIALLLSAGNGYTWSCLAVRRG